MPYRKNSELPPGVKDHLPPHAQDIYRESFNAAWDEYKSHEETAHKVAWAAVKKEYEKDPGGKWVKAA
jgi:cation transport regulator